MQKKTSITFKATNVFYRNLNSTARIIVNRGGSGSSKSISILQVFVYKLLTEKDKKLVVLRKTLPSLRNSTYEAFLEIIDRINIRGLLKEDKQFLTYRYGGGYIRFGSLDVAEKIKSSNVNYIFMEEATEFTLEDYRKLNLILRAPSLDGKRNQLFMAFNPINKFHWIKKEVIDKEKDVEEIVSTYKDNPFVDTDFKNALEATASQDYNFYTIYAKGGWGSLSNLVYENWTVVDESSISRDDFVDIIYGLDFGYNKPSALVSVSFDKKDSTKLLVEELLYKSKLTNTQLIEKLLKIIPDKYKHRPVYCDNAEPDRIKELRHAGINAKPCKKKRRKSQSIDIVKEHKLVIPITSSNLIKEIQAYSWKTDKEGEASDESPIEINNHLLDAMLYAVVSFRKGKRIKFRWLS
jgi:phage terminase large subunit